MGKKSSLKTLSFFNLKELIKSFKKSSLIPEKQHIIIAIMNIDVFLKS